MEGGLGWAGLGEGWGRDVKVDGLENLEGHEME